VTDATWRHACCALTQMSEPTALKQARQKAFASFGADADAKLHERGDLIGRAMTAARGNAGLQDLLLRAVMADRVAGQTAIEALEVFLADGVLPSASAPRDTLEHLAVDGLMTALAAGERALLHASTLSPIPLPIEVWRGFAVERDMAPPIGCSPSGSGSGCRIWWTPSGTRWSATRL
jgi:hypothetical protein